MMSTSYADLRCEWHHCGHSWRVYDYVIALSEIGSSVPHPCPQCHTSTSEVIATHLVTMPPTDDVWLWPEFIDG